MTNRSAASISNVRSGHRPDRKEHPNGKPRPNNAYRAPEESAALTYTQEKTDIYLSTKDDIYQGIEAFNCKLALYMINY